MVNKVLFSSKSDEWETPWNLFNELDKEFVFQFDVCATHKNAKCKRYFTKEIDGLKQDWIITAKNIKLPWGAFWCNPPYSQIEKWVQKANWEMYNYNYPFYPECAGYEIVMLLPARTDTKWFHNYIYKNPNCEIRFLKGRLKFSGSKNSAPFPSMIVIFK